jgi:FkbM family methyltransferase
MPFDDFAVALVRTAPFGYFKLAQALRALRPSLGHYRAATRYGPLVCDIAEPGSFPLVRSGCYPHWSADEEAIAQIPLDNAVVVDIGANIGAMTRLFSRRAKVVHAFEPAARALKYLRANADPNVVIHPVALFDHNGTALFEERQSVDRSSFSDRGSKVPVRTLDSFNLRPNLIKVDVEGYEPQVLRGAYETLKRGPIVLFEALDAAALSDSKEVLRDANPSYGFEQISGMNYLARPR